VPVPRQLDWRARLMEYANHRLGMIEKQHCFSTRR
jgi:hypothetical protein